MINILKLRKMEKERSEEEKQNVNPEDEVVSLDEGKVVKEQVEKKAAEDKTVSEKEKKKKESVNDKKEHEKKKKVTEKNKKLEEKKKKAAHKKKKEEKKKSSNKKKQEKIVESQKNIPEIEEMPLEEVSVIENQVQEEIKSDAVEKTVNPDAEEAFRQKLMEELLAEDFSVEPEIEEWPSDIFGNGGKQEKKEETTEKSVEAETPAPQEKPKPAAGTEDDLPQLTPEEQAEIDRKKAETLQKFLSKTTGKPEDTKPAKVKPEKPIAKKESKKLVNEEKEKPAAEPSEKIDSSDDSKNKKIENTVQLIGFKLADEVYGIDINCIREINRITSITLVPNVPEYVEGVINLRGNVIPIINLRVKTKMPRKDFDSETRVIIIENENIVVGFIVDEVKEVLRIPESIITPPPAIAVSEAAEYIKAVARTESGLIILLDTDKLLDRVDFI